MAKRKNPSRVNIPMCAAGVLLCLTLFSAHFTSGLYAKYTATATGSDSARVAKFEVNFTKENPLDTPPVVITSSEVTDNAFEFNIDNQSEVAVSYTLALTQGIPGVTATFDQTSGTLAVGEGATHTVTFAVTNWPDFINGEGAVSELRSGDALTKDYNFTITVNITQID